MSRIRDSKPKSGYNALCVAIIERAIQDYEIGLNLTKKNRVRNPENIRFIKEVETFFKSEWFRALAKSDGEAILKAIKMNYEKYGGCLLKESCYKFHN